jgi:hypothetical protein
MRNNIRNMRNSSVLTALFPQVRQGVLAATLTQPGKWWYLSELADRLGTSPSSLQRELSSLVASGILVHRREGTRAYFKAQTQSPVFRDLQQLFEKTAGKPVSFAGFQAPPAISTFFSFPLAKNPMDRPSGDQKGWNAPSVPGTAACARLPTCVQITYLFD